MKRLLALQSALTVLAAVAPSSCTYCIAFGAPIEWRQEIESERGADESEKAAIAAIEQAGGRVMRISAADESREVIWHLSSQDVVDDQLASLPKIANVIWLNLAGTKITDSGLVHLSTMTGLKKLHLERTGIGDIGVSHLIALQELEYLNLYGTRTTDAAVDELAKLKKLKKLYIWQTAITEEGIKRLNQALPELEVIGEIKFQIIPPPAENAPEKAVESAAEIEEKDKSADDKSTDDKSTDDKS